MGQVFKRIRWVEIACYFLVLGVVVALGSTALYIPFGPDQSVIFSWRVKPGGWRALVCRLLG